MNVEEISPSEESICVFTANGKNIDISDGYIDDNDGREKVQLVCLSAEGDYNEISPEDVTDVIKTAMICGRKKFIYTFKKNKRNSSGKKRKICSPEVEFENIDNSNTPKKSVNNSLMTRLEIDNNFGSKEVFYSVSKLKLFNNWYLKNRSEDEILKFKYDRKHFMKVLYSFNPIVKLDKINPADYIVTSNSKYKSTFLKLIGLEKNPDSQISHSETEISDAVSSDNEKNGKKSESNNLFTFQSWITKKNPTKMLLTKRPVKSNQDTKISLKPRAIYTTEEDKFILKWVLKNENSKMVNGNTFWKDLERQNLPYERSWQSLRNRYLKNILFNLRSYGLSSSEEMRLKVGAEQGCIKKFKMFKHSSSPRGNKNKLTVNGNTYPTTSRTSPKKNIQNRDNYEDSDILSDDTSTMSYKDFKASAEKKKKRQLFTNKTFLQSTHRSDHDSS